MDESKWVLPFGLALEDLLKVQVTCGHYFPKPDAGRQEIRISGLKGITLYHTAKAKAEPEIREAKIGPEALARLLDVFEEESFFTLDDDYTENPDGVVRFVALSLPGKSFQATAAGMDVPELERLIGAVKLAAGLGTPQALGRRFFPDL